MADGCIEQALTALNQTWSHHGCMTVSIPQISDGFGKLQAEIRNLSSELHRAVQRITDQDQTITRLHVELSSVKSTLSSATKTLSSLFEGSNMIVRQADLAKALRNVADADSLNIVKEVLERIQTRVSGMADETVIQILSDTTQSNKSSIDNLANKLSEEVRASRTQTSAIEHELAETSKKFGSSLTRLSGEVARSHDFTERRCAAMKEDFLRQLATSRKEADEALAASVTELVEHIKVQAHAVEELQRERADRGKDAPSKDEIVQIRVEMDAVKRDIERAQFKIHESYSQCLAIAKHTGQQTSSTQGISMLSSSSILPAKSIHFDSQRQEIPSSVEVQLELLKRDVNKIFTEALPHTNNAVAAQREQLEGVVEAHFRAQEHLESLLQCLLGPGGTSDELLSALSLRDNSRIKLILRRCLNAVTEGGGARTPSAPQQQADKAPLQLGIDVADFADKATKEISVQVMRVSPNSAGAQCGLQAKDRILQVGDMPVTSVQSFVLALRKIDNARSRQSLRRSESVEAPLEMHVRRGAEVKVLYVPL
jgi:hypothetical protein